MCHLYRVGVAELVRGEAAPHAGLSGEAAQLYPYSWRGP